MNPIYRISFTGLASSLSYIALGGIRFYDVNGTMYTSGTLSTNTTTQGVFTNMNDTSDAAYADGYVYPSRAINTALTQTGPRTTSGYYMAANKTGTKLIHVYPTPTWTTISRIEFVPLPDTAYTNRGTTSNFTITAYDSSLNVLASYNIIPTTNDNTVQTQYTPELSIINVTSVSLTPKPYSLKIGDTYTLTATVLPSNATNKSVTWESSAPGVATVHSTTGLITAIALGDTTITVTTVDQSKTDTCVITVRKPLTSISLDQSTKTLWTGESFTLIPFYEPSDATYKSVTWNSSSPGVASVVNGLVTWLSVGTTTIVATSTYDNKTVSCDITTRARVSSVTLDKSLVYGKPGQTIQLTETVLPSNAYNKGINWVSSNASIATVSSSGLITIVALGKVTISATSQDNGSINASCICNFNTAIGSEITFNYTGAEVPFNIPTGVTKVKFEVWGGKGGSGGAGTPLGGQGGYSYGYVSPSTYGEEVFYLRVGGNGDVQNGWNGGGASGGSGAGKGGGATDICRGGNALANRILVAGGGGGAPSGNAVMYTLGLGGGDTGARVTCYYRNTQYSAASQSAGEPAGSGVQGQMGSTAGTSGQGGAGGTSTINGGGGGGGFFGGGGGCGTNNIGDPSGGGGGSGYIGGVSSGVTQQGGSDNGKIVITILEMSIPRRDSKVKIGGTYKSIEMKYIKVAGAWANVLEERVKIGGSFKSMPIVGGLLPWKKVFNSSTTWTVPTGVTSVDVFLVGGGGGGANTCNMNGQYAAGGSSGFTKTVLAVAVTPGQQITIEVGAGGTGVTSTNGTAPAYYAGGVGGYSRFNNDNNIKALGGGSSATLTYAGTGGSGGGAGINQGGGSGGSDGSNAYGTGQGTTTKEFGESTGTLYAGGGGGGLYNTTGANGGAGGGGQGGGDLSAQVATSGTTNTGSGGGGANKQNTTSRTSGNGGSGIVVVRFNGNS
jgi:uncharacterized protein YjdB